MHIWYYARGAGGMRAEGEGKMAHGQLATTRLLGFARFSRLRFTSLVRRPTCDFDGGAGLVVRSREHCPWSTKKKKKLRPVCALLSLIFHVASTRYHAPRTSTAIPDPVRSPSHVTIHLLYAPLSTMSMSLSVSALYVLTKSAGKLSIK